MQKPQLGLKKEFRHSAELIGQFLTMLIVAGFIACPWYTYAKLQQEA